MSTTRTQYTNGPNENTFFILTSSDFSCNVQISDRYVLAVGTGDSGTIFDLPKGTLGEVHFFKDATTANGQTFTIQPFLGQTIDGNSTIFFGARQSIGIFFDGAEWRSFTTNTPRTPTELVFTAGVFNTGLTTPTRVGGRYVDLTNFVVLTSGAGGSYATSAQFYADIETTAGTANIQLYNVTDGEVVTGSALTTTNTTNTEVVGGLTIGNAAGNLKSGKVYEVDIYITGGGPTDRTTCTNARLVFSYS